MVLKIAFMPMTSPPPIIRSGHVSYLADFLAKWISRNIDIIPSNNLPLFSVSTFLRAVIDILALSDISLWASKAISRFTHSVKVADIDSFVTFQDSLAEIIHDCHLVRSGMGKGMETPGIVDVRDSLGDWMNKLFVVTTSTSPTLAEGSHRPNLDSIILLNQCQNYGIHTLKLGASLPPPQDELPDAIVTLATHLHITYPPQVPSVFLFAVNTCLDAKDLKALRDEPQLVLLDSVSIKPDVILLLDTLFHIPISMAKPSPNGGRQAIKTRMDMRTSIEILRSDLDSIL
ncbi:hypothetical protein DFJ58DRAFT_733829 [Suillus subalutaceus]|uniref:uncharacterized protein n=1 Tax=Suillus subalutaceus TaxID=48586 RepID=UPI001B87BDC2|nr:uncharacterized protein DFJ58DRAFT_733829 [Suillus subalutaceus]KAG1838455.1 hypothetical protein DFJ58DRAFT_733829 [Suillus subalutaceus]